MKEPRERRQRIVSVRSEQKGGEILVHVRYSSGLVRTRSFTNEADHDAYCQEIMQRIARETR